MPTKCRSWTVAASLSRFAVPEGGETDARFSLSTKILASGVMRARAGTPSSAHSPRRRKHKRGVPSPQLFLKPSKLDPRLSAPKTTTHRTPNELGPLLSAPKTTTRRRRHTFPGTPPFPRPPPRRTHFGSSQTPTSHLRAFRFVAQRNQRRRGLVSFIRSGF